MSAHLRPDGLVVIEPFIDPAGKVSVAEPVCFDIAMFTAGHLREAMESAGLEVFHDPEGLMGRGLYIGRAPGSAP